MSNLKEQIKEARDKVIKARNELSALKRQCTHVFKPLTREQLADEWMSECAVCLICEDGFGWRCKKSPDGSCHYFSDHGLNAVKLIDGRMHKLSDEHIKNEETDDCCIFCGMPEERK